MSSTITGNLIFKAGGGGISNSGAGTVNVSNSTVTNNGAEQGRGGGVYNAGTGAVNVKSSIIALNTAEFGPDAYGNFVSAGFNLIGAVDYSSGFIALTDLYGTIATPLDPLVDLNGTQENGGPTQTIALLCESPAVDKGTRLGFNGPLFVDQRGFLRTVDDPLVADAAGGDGTDIGAFETQNCGAPPPTPTPTPTPTPSPSCLHGQGYWKNNPNAWPITTIVLGGQTYTQTQLLTILSTPVGKGKNTDASLILAHQWIAAQLNIANGSDPTPVAAAIAQANSLLSVCTLPCGVKASSALGQQMIAVAALLEQYNSGLLTTNCGP